MKLRYSFSKLQECELVHEYSIDLLAKTGVSVLSQRVRELLKKRGAIIDGTKVCMPEHMVREALETAPSGFVFKTKKHRVAVGNGSSCLVPGYGATNIRRNGRERLGTREDFLNFTKLIQMSPDMALSCPYILEPYDLPFEYRNQYKMVMTLKYSDKPTFSITQDYETAQQSIITIKQHFDDFKHYLMIGNINISAPLIVGEGTAEVILAHCEGDQPLMISCGSGLSGLTAPPLPAGNLLMSNTGVLAGIVIAQMLKPGLPVIYGFPLFGVDPYNADVSVGSPVSALFTMAAVEMGRYYNLPVRLGGVFTDASDLNYQSGFESFMNLFSSLYSGADCIMQTFGMENALNTLNYNKFILDEAMYHSVQSYLRGFEINDVTLMKSEIEKIGSDGNYISMGNLRLIRKQYEPYPYAEKEDQTVMEMTEQEIQGRLEHYREPELTEAQKNNLKKILPDELMD